MYATHAIDRYNTIKIEHQHRLARAQRRYDFSNSTPARMPQPTPLRSPNLRRRAAVAVATLAVSLGILAGAAAAAQDVGGATGSHGASGCVRVVGGRVLC
jgi:hypothetical protein